MLGCGEFCAYYDWTFEYLRKLGGEEAEPKDCLGRDHYERRAPEQEHRGYRNGYEPGYVCTSEGELTVQVPQNRDTPEPYPSKLMRGLGRRSSSSGYLGC